MQGGELLPERYGDQQEDDDPAGVQVNGNAEDAEELKSAGELAGARGCAGGGWRAGMLWIRSGSGCRCGGHGCSSA